MAWPGGSLWGFTLRALHSHGSIPHLGHTQDFPILPPHTVSSSLGPSLSGTPVPSHHITGPCVSMSLLCALANLVALLTPSIPHVSTQVGPFLSHTSPEPQLRPGVWSLALREPFYLCSSGLSIVLCHHPTPCVCLTSPGLHETGIVSFLPLDP